MFKPGDLVELKSGGPVMTVETVDTLSVNRGEPPNYYCSWFAGAKDNKRRFAEAALKAAEE
jgi:uncharacterized protein YodC (DUF2158 family)